MAPARRLGPADQLAIGGLLARYCQIVDDGEFDRLSQVFAPEALHTIDGMGGETVRHQGVASIIAFISARQVDGWRGKHILSVPIIEVPEPTRSGRRMLGFRRAARRATALTEVTFVNRTGPDGSLRVATTGRYHDTLERDGGRWAIVRRAISMY